MDSFSRDHNGTFLASEHVPGRGGVAEPVNETYQLYRELRRLARERVISNDGESNGWALGGCAGDLGAITREWRPFERILDSRTFWGRGEE